MVIRVVKHSGFRHIDLQQCHMHKVFFAASEYSKSKRSVISSSRLIGGPFVSSDKVQHWPEPNNFRGSQASYFSLQHRERRAPVA